MTTLEAYHETLAAVAELQALGIGVNMKPPESRNDQELVAKYSGPERIPPDKWLHVTFRPQTHEHKHAIAEKAKHLGWLGIAFDTGGSTGTRDWELDWSFRYTSRPDGELEKRREVAETIITDVMEGGSNE